MSRLDECELGNPFDLERWAGRSRRTLGKTEKGDRLNLAHSAQPGGFRSTPIIRPRSIHRARDTRSRRPAIRPFVVNCERVRAFPCRHALLFPFLGTRRFSPCLDPPSQGSHSRRSTLRSKTTDSPRVVRQPRNPQFLRPLLVFAKPLSSPRNSSISSQPRKAQTVTTLLYLDADQPPSFAKHLVRFFPFPLFPRDQRSPPFPHSSRPPPTPFSVPSHILVKLYSLVRSHTRIDPLEPSFTPSPKPLPHLGFSWSPNLSRNLPTCPLLAINSPLHFA